MVAECSGDCRAVAECGGGCMWCGGRCSGGWVKWQVHVVMIGFWIKPTVSPGGKKN